MSVLKINNKKGVSILVGYVLLITIAIIMAGVVYTWLKSYVPQDSIECPDGISVFIKNVECGIKDGKYFLDLSIENNGRFEFDGYFIKVAESETMQIAVKDISKSLVSGGSSAGGVVRFSKPLKAGETATIAKFNLDKPIYFLEVMPVIYETVDNQIRQVSCGKAQVKENVNCGIF